jgi:ribose-phosphate pyrophosphokinase
VRVGACRAHLITGAGQPARDFDPVVVGSKPSAPTTNCEPRSAPISGSAHPSLAREIAEHLSLPLGAARLHRFPDTEVSFQIDENIRGTDVFVVQPTSAPVDQHLIELCVMIDAFRRSSASRITAVLPYYGYGRQDRKDKPRVPISAKLVANLLSAANETVCSRWICTRRRFRGSLTFRWTTCSRRP